MEPAGTLLLGPPFVAAERKVARSAARARATARARLALPFVSSGLAVAAFPPLGWWPLAWISLVPLISFLARERSARRRIVASGLAGTVFFAAGCAWLTKATAPGWLALSVYAGGASWALFAWLAAPALRSPRASVRLLMPVAAWVASEYLRGVLPANLPWLFLAHTQAAYPPMVQSASWGGAWLVTALVVIGNVALALGARERLALVAVGSIVALAGARPGPLSTATLQVGIVQPELSPREKTDPTLQTAAIARLTSLSRDIAARSELDVIVWPESSYPRTLGKDPAALLELAALIRGLGHPLVTGVMTKSDRLRNSVVALDASGRVTSVYDKQRLVFVAEYLPPWIRGSFLEPLVTGGTRLPHRFDFAPGERSTVFDVAGVPAAAAICLEHSSFAHVRKAVGRGARLVLNVGNESVFGGTAELAQALHIATLRAVENRVPVVRVLNSGISGVIAPDGSLRALPAGARAEAVDVGIPGGARTLYTTLGDWVAYASLAALAAHRLLRAGFTPAWLRGSPAPLESLPGAACGASASGG